MRDRISIAGFDNSTATIASIFAAYGGTTVDEKIYFAINLVQTLFYVSGGTAIRNRIGDKEFAAWRSVVNVPEPSNKRARDQVQKTERTTLNEDFVSSRLVLAPNVFNAMGALTNIRPEVIMVDGPIRLVQVTQNPSSCTNQLFLEIGS